MTRENKLALIIGFSLILVVAILITDHLSPAQSDRMARLDDANSNGRNNSSLTLRATLPSGAAGEVRGNESGGTTRISGGGDGAYRNGNQERSTVIHKEPERVISLQPARQAAQTEEMPPIEMGRPTPSTSDSDGNAQEHRLPDSRSTMRIHVVRKGDSLYQIARKYYGDPALARQLAEFNRGRIMSGMNIRVGVTLRIPDRTQLTGSTVKQPNKLTGSTKQNTKPARYTTYKIKPGDTLGEISLRLLGTSKRWQEIVDLNKNIINDPASIPVGKTIRIPRRKK